MADVPRYRRDPADLERVRLEVASVQPKLEFVDQGEAVLLRGIFDVQDADRVHAAFEIELLPCPDSAHGVPVVREVGGRIPWVTDPHHVNSDGTLCVVLPDAYWYDYPGGLSLAGYLSGPLRAHLAGQELVLRGDPWPAGEWAHGEAGVRQFYEGLLKITGDGTLARMLDFAARDVIPLLLECPCGSHKPVRDCHAPTLHQLQERLPRAVRRAAWRAVRGRRAEVIVRIEVSYPIGDDDIEDAVGRESLADIRVRPGDGQDPAPGTIRSPDDVLAVRKAFRSALAAVAEARPNAELIHLFVAAPVSVCFVIGQELRLRNGRDVQTYRYRPVEGDNAYRPTLLLTAEGQRVASRPLTPEDIALAADLRSVWAEALNDVVQHALGKREETDGPVAGWHQHLQPGELQSFTPFPGLKPLWEMVRDGDTLSAEPRAEDYEFSKKSRSWRVSDALVLGLFRASGEDRVRMRELVRLFFYHEYLHDWQVLTKYTAENVGGFANCLERIDYMADTYAILHQLDYVIRHDRARVATAEQRQRLLVDQIRLAIKSFWAFEPTPPAYEWQERRLRRYLNWYWRRVQLREAPSLEVAVRILLRQPSIEIAGLRYSSRGGRHYVRLNEVQPGMILEVGLVLEDGRFFRRGSTADLSNEEAMLAFANQETAEIDRYFNSLFEHVRQTGGAFPPE